MNKKKKLSNELMVSLKEAIAKKSKFTGIELTRAQAIMLHENGMSSDFIYEVTHLNRVGGSD